MLGERRENKAIAMSFQRSVLKCNKAMVLMEKILFLRVTMRKSLRLAFREFWKIPDLVKRLDSYTKSLFYLSYCNIPVEKSYFTPLVKNFRYCIFRFRCKDSRFWAGLIHLRQKGALILATCRMDGWSILGRRFDLFQSLLTSKIILVIPKNIWLPLQSFSFTLEVSWLTQGEAIAGFWVTV